MDKYAETKQILNDMASVKMAMNSHKGKIESGETDHIMRKLKEECRELEQALAEGNIMDVLQEAADVHNFLIAIVQKEVDQYRSRK